MPRNMDNLEYGTRLEVMTYPAENTLLKGRYRLVKLVKRGGMSAVYKALDETLSDKNKPVYVAIKCIAPDLMNNRRALKNFKDEALRNMQDLSSHPNIARIFSYEEEAGQYFLIMQWLDGQDLEDELDDYHDQNKHISLSDALAYVKDIVSGLDYTHKKGIIHRDIKPGNLFKCTDGRIVLLDFGIARVITDTRSRLSNSGLMSGTYEYLPPEAGIAGHKADTQDDIYGLAVTLYQLLSDELPFKHEQASQRSKAMEDRLAKPSNELNECQWQVLRNAFCFNKDERKITKVTEFYQQLISPPLSDYGIDMVAISGGTFVMGSPKDEKGRQDNEKRHQVVVSDFKINRNLVTRKAFKQFIKTTGYTTDAQNNKEVKGCWSYKEDKWGYHAGRNYMNPGFSQQDKHPVICVSHNDVMAYIDWLNKQTGQTFRLPTEAEWEYAARGGTTTARFWGDDPNKACACANVADKTLIKEMSKNFSVHQCSDGYAYTSPAGHYQSNAYGLNDMLGNVWEWTCSPWGSDYTGQEQQCSDSATVFAVRGGSWDSKPDWVRAAMRERLNASTRLTNKGFRLVQVN